MLFNEIKLWPSTNTKIEYINCEEAIRETYGLVDIFNQQNIEYCVVGGTLLGAVRHQGFMPWDDDVDFLMEAEKIEYLKKLEIFEQNGFRVEVFDSNVHSANILKLWKNNIHYDIWPFRHENENICTHVGMFPIIKTFPHKTYPFEFFSVKVPYDPDYFLDRNFTNWREFIKIKYNKYGINLMVRRNLT